MADDTIEAGIDEALAALHLDGAREILVLPQHLGPHPIACKEEERSDRDHPGGHSYPLEAEVEAGADKAGKEDQACQSGHRPLLPLLLLRRKASLEEGRILDQQSDAGDGHRDEEQGEEEPSIGVVHRPGGDEQQQGGESERSGELHHGLDYQISLHAVLRSVRRDPHSGHIAHAHRITLWSATPRSRYGSSGYAEFPHCF